MDINDPRARQVNPDISAPEAAADKLNSLPAPQTPMNSTDVPTLPMEMSMKKPKNHKKLPMVPIIIAISVALVLIGLTTAIFVLSRKKPAPKPVQNNNQNTTASNRVSPDDVENVKGDIDKNLTNISDSTDFRVDDLTNQTLGL